MSNLSNSKTNLIYLIFFAINLLLLSEVAAQEQNQILYPSVLSLNNQGLVAVQADGIHFYDSDKKEEITKKIKFESALISQEDTYKISMTQFSENDGGFILILVIDKLFLIQETGELIKEILLPEMKNLENMNIIPYKENNNNLYYIISFKKDTKHYGFNYYKYDLIKNSNSLINSKSLEGIKNKGSFISYDIHGENCLFMKELDTEKDIFSCFLGIGFPAEIQVRTFDINYEIIKEKNSYRYSLGQNDIKSFNLISALLTNDNKSSSIIYYDKNNILSKIEFDFEQGLFSPNIIDIEKEVNLTDHFWEEASKKMDESKESIYSSRLYLAYCKSYIIFFNSNFTLQNKGFISHDNKCSKLLSYSEFFKDNKYSLSIERINNNKILIQKKRKLARSCAETQVPEKCDSSSGGYSDESLTYNLCLKCNTDGGYYKVYDPNNTIYAHGSGFVECFNNDTKKNFYLDNSDENNVNWQYKPCYETCNTCSQGGDAYDHKCDTCALKYKFFDDNGKMLCEAECSYAYYYTFPLDYYECSSTNSCPEEAGYYVPALKKCVKSCASETGYEYNYGGNCYPSCNDANAEEDEENPNNCKDPTPQPGDPRCIVTYNSFDSENFITADGITSNAKTYAKSFSDTTTHVNYYNNSNAILVIYKDETCITELDLTVPKIDLDDICDAKIYEYLGNKYSNFDKDTDLITALVGGSTSSSGVKSYFSLFYKDGTYINTTEICGATQVQVTNQIDLEEVDDEAELIAAQGVDIFDLDSPFYNDVCFMYDSPNGKDATPNDRLNKYYPNISICETGCTPSKVNLTSFEAICKCEFNDIMSSTGVGEKLIEDSFGEIFEMIDNSNIVIFKCISDVFVAKHFFKNVGTYIALGIMVAQIACVVVYYLVSYSPILRYLFYLSEYQCTVIDQKNGKKEGKDKIKDNILNSKLQKPKAPPKKDELKTPAADKLILDEDKKDPKKLDLNENDPNINSNNKLTNKKKDEKNEKETGKKGGKNEKKSGSGYGDKLKDEYDVDMEEYLKTDVEDMEFEDALKYDKRGFCEYFWEKFKEEQIIMDTFFNPEALKPMTIKIIILLLNIILYFVINGLFYSEEYVSDLFNSEEEEKFFSFFPRSISRFLYTTIVGVIIGIIVDFVSVDEKKVKRLFLREKKNTLQIRYEMGEITKDIKRNYLILIIICFVIDLICLYYVNCFNNVYPNLTGEWIKSSICIIIIMQILTVLEGLLIAIIRAIAFKCKSERIYKIKDLFD